MKYELTKVEPLKLNNFKLYDNYINDVLPIFDKDQFKEKDKNTLF